MPNNFNTFRFSFGFNVQMERVTKNRFTERKKNHTAFKDEDGQKKLTRNTRIHWWATPSRTKLLGKVVKR